jgi:hypothetical protein
MNRMLVPAFLVFALLLFRLLRGSLLLVGAALVATLLALLGSQIVRKRSAVSRGPDRDPEIASRPDAGTLHRPYDPALVVDARYEEIE